MKTCLLFPGQGAQYPGMGKDLYDSSTRVKELFDLASKTTDIDARRLLFEGTEDELKQTNNTQIAVTLVNLSSAAVLADRGVEAAGCAGFSLGEYAALVQAGVLAPEDVFPLVKSRGELMDQAAAELGAGENAPGMAAVIGLSADRVIKAVEDAGIEGVYPANYNSPSQMVLSGTAAGLAAAEPVCKEAGAKRFIRLKVSAPFHSPLLSEVQRRFAEVVKDYTFNNPKILLYSNVTGGRVDSGEQARQLAVEQIVSGVRWTDEEQAIVDDGFERCLETGPGKVLSGLWKAAGKEIKCSPAGTIEAIDSALV
ncbi:MAG: ACP S-malonyltransferase [Spirochaetales bacterium]|nr:ACP S-malonyltransferase [Spirochaetales bacterium]MCF7937506.1 ACP S-malonyltransferase [Spirochaetales bacterium]